jgi:hypothetical protein
VVLEETITSIMALCGRNESVSVTKCAELGRDVFGNKNGASSEGGSRPGSEQSEGAGAVSGKASGAMHIKTVFWCGWYREK